VDQQFSRFASRMLLFRMLAVGYMVNEHYIQMGKEPDGFWQELASGSEEHKVFNSKTWLFEARRLYLAYKRYLIIFDSCLCFENFTIPLQVTKTHLILIFKYCKDDEQQQEIFINKVVKESLSTIELKKSLIDGIPNSPKNLIIVPGLTIKKSCDLSSLGFTQVLNEVEIVRHIIANVDKFISIVLNNQWSYLPHANIFTGGRNKRPDMVFYNVIIHRYCIIDFKTRSLVSDIDRASSQMQSYVNAFDSIIDNSHHEKSLGIILGLWPIDEFYFRSLGTKSNIFYCSFSI
jgi:hypothetical protein